MNGYLSVFVLFAIIITSIGMAPAFAQMDSPISITTDKSSYLIDQKILIRGDVKVAYPGFPLTIMVNAPNGNLVFIDQITVGNHKKFSTELVAGGNLMSVRGEYTILAHYGTFKEIIVFEFEGTSNVMAGFLTVDDSTEMIEYEIKGATISSISPDVDSNSLIISIDAASDGTVTLTIPRSILDSVENGEDAEIFIYIDNVEINFDETITSKDRTIIISFPADTKTIEIIGTFVIPEFGTIAMMILAVAIISIVAVTAKSRLSIMPKL